ncbi:MAG: alpha-amylase family glycosyl hydrolase [Kiritimatiellae bacterium]|nr:alpha-amylase family glycosyl hydrolase [Kiritimatiellia bacterium]
MNKVKPSVLLILVCTLFSLTIPAGAEVMLQWFESDWDEMYQKMPLVAQTGYDWLWIPPPTKGPVGSSVTWANVGYNLYDRFDIGDIPQRGTLETRYGTRGSLNAMIDAAHGLDIKIIPDIVMNHNGNGPDIREYPGMTAEDFHVKWSANYAGNLNYERAPRMNWWYHHGGYGGTMWSDLANLADIRTEDHPLNGDPLRFTGPKTDSDGNSFDFVGSRPDYIRHVGQYDKYPYAYTNELVAEMLYRWIAWLGDAIDYDGLRIDAAKHTPYEFFGWRGAGFLHEAQWNFSQRRGYSFGGDPTDLFQNYVLRTNALLFAEILSPWSEIEYWHGYGSNDRNPMRFLDYAVKKHLDSKFNGDMNGLGSFGSNFDETKGIYYAWGHDEGGASKIDLAYAYILTHIGFPMVYYTGNNITWADSGRAPYPDKRTWMIPGYDSKALGEQYNDIANLVWIHQNFTRGREYKRWENDGDFFALERYDDTVIANGAPDEGEGLVLVALNDSGWDQTRTLNTCFPNGTVLKDYTGKNPNEVTVSGGQVTITVPGNSGQGWVCYAPKIADPVNVRVLQGGSDAPTMTWIIPGGVHQADTTQQITRITSTNFTVETTFTPPAGGSVDNVMLKWGRGVHLPVTNYFSEGRDVVSGHFHSMNRNDATNYSLGITITETNLPEGLNVIKCRAFNQRTAGYSALFNTATKVVYVDRRGPDLSLNVSENQSMVSEFVLIITNSDRTAYGMTVSVNGGAAEAADEVMKGLWKYGITGLSAGTHTAVVTATEADYAASRQVINTSTLTRVFQITDNYEGIGFNHSANAVIELPFFQTVVTGGSESYSSLRIFWDGYELPFNGGNRTNVFNGEIIFRDQTSVVTNRFWGNFINGPHYFETERVDGIYTSRVVRRVVFSLYGNNHIDSDGDGLPDNVEMPFFDQGAPGPDQPWPGDSNNNFVPESWETWTRLNPYNHATFYGATWDDQLDSDGDGYSNYAEVEAGYAEDGNVYKYSIYDSGSFPSGTPMTASSAGWTPTLAVRGSPLTVTYYPNEGALDNASQVWMHIGHSKKTMGDWQEVYDTNMTVYAGSNWQVTVTVPTNATSVDFTFWDGTSTWDGKDWQANVAGVTNMSFTMDGALDSSDFAVWEDGMWIWAAARGTKLYVATWASGSGGNDHFLYVTDEPGDAQATPWAKAGYVFLDAAAKPYLAGEGDNSWSGWFNISGNSTNVKGAGAYNYLEGEIDLIDAFGYVPDAVYLASAAYENWDAGALTSQGPHMWDGGDNIDATELLRVPIDSIRDEDADGYFDAGRPQMWTVVNGNTNDANYGMRRFFINELANESREITVILQPNAGVGNTVSDVELFSNLNRRDFATLDEDPDSVTVTSGTNYYRAWPMTDIGGGKYRVTVPVNKCGAYRINARYKINGGDYVYYTDNGLRRDCAVVVTPQKALELVMYELNPLIAEATSDSFAGRSTFEDMYRVNTDRPDAVSTSRLAQLGINMVWLQPIHPIGSDNRQIDPATGLPYDPGSPYAVRNYWKVNSILGDPSSDAQALSEFQDFVGALDNIGVGVMLDGTFNHSAWDCEIGQPAVDMFAWASNASDLIREVRPQWYSKYNSYGQPASYYESAINNDIAPAPDRMDFGKWTDAADFYFGTYDALVAGIPSDTNWAWSSGWYSRYLFEEDRFDGFASGYTRDLWEYFAHYPVYWLEKTGHPDGTPKSESYKGIDGLRCDFAQGLPSEFWEYTINKTRSVKWDFLFMAESLDGYREVGGSKRHGVGYRSARHFDILNENMVFYWRDNFFDYFGSGGQPQTYPTWQAFDNRRNAFDVVPILLNLTSHDEIYPTDDQWRLIYAHSIVSAWDGIPMMVYGQEAAAQNDASTYTNRGINPANNFARYETNFGKSIPNFKRYNHMTNIWNGLDSSWKTSMYETYQRINNARLGSPALRSQQNYMLEGTNGWNPDIFCTIKYQAPGISAASQDVVIVAINNNYAGSTNRWDNFNLDVDYTPGVNWFGIQDSHYYNVVDLMGANPTNYLWAEPGQLGSAIKADFWVLLNGNPFEGQQAQYLRLIDRTAGNTPETVVNYFAWDRDGDGLPDDWESANSLDPNSSSDDDGAAGDPDDDDMTNAQELLAGTDPQTKDALELGIDVAGSAVDVWWNSITDINYILQRSDSLTSGPGWETIYFGTAMDTNAIVTDTTSGSVTSRYYRAVVVP